MKKKKKYSEVVKGNSGLFFIGLSLNESLTKENSGEFESLSQSPVVSGKIHMGTQAPPTPGATEWFICFGCEASEEWFSFHSQLGITAWLGTLGPSWKEKPEPSLFYDR